LWHLSHPKEGRIDELGSIQDKVRSTKEQGKTTLADNGGAR
jgi:hypothetical protein